MTLPKRAAGRPSGFTFNELLVAINIVAVAVLGYSLSSFDVLRRQTAGDNSTVAIHLAQDKIEELQARKNLPEGDLCPSGGDRGISATVKRAGIFDRCWRVTTSALGDDLKQLEVTVFWRDHSDHRVTLSTLKYSAD